jgi:WD40 repeat protein
MIRWQAHTAKVTALAVSPDGRFLASAAFKSTLVKVWDAATGAAVATLRGQPTPVRGLAFRPTGGLLAALCDGNAVVHETDRWTRVCLLSAHGLEDGLAFAPDGAVAVCSHAAVCWYDAPHRPLPLPGRHLADRAVRPGGSSLAFTPDGRVLVVNGGDGCTVWDAAAGEPVRTLPHRPTFIRTATAVSPDGRRAAASYDRDVDLWRLDDPAAPPVTLAGGRGNRSVRAVAFTPDGRALLSVASDGVARVWDAATGVERRALDWGVGSLQSAVVAPDGLTAAAGGGDGSIVVWDLDG